MAKTPRWVWPDLLTPAGDGMDVSWTCRGRVVDVSWTCRGRVSPNRLLPRLQQRYRRPSPAASSASSACSRVVCRPRPFLLAARQQAGRLVHSLVVRRRDVPWRCALLCERLRCEPWRPLGMGGDYPRA